MYTMLGAQQRGLEMGRLQMRSMLRYRAPGGSARTLRGLGTAQSTSQIATAVSVSGSVLAAIPAVAAAVPVIGPIVAGLVALISVLGVGKGCGQACVTAAETEQIFEGAANAIDAVYKAGMLSGSDAIACMQWILAQGQQTEGSIGTKQGQAGESNMTKVINDEMSIVDSTQPQTVTLDPTQLQSIMQSNLQGNWYPSSVNAALSLAVQAIMALPDYSQTLTLGASSAATGASAVTNAANSVIASVQSLVQSNPTIALAGVGLIAMLFLL